MDSSNSNGVRVRLVDMLKTLRVRVGCWFHERWRTEGVLCAPGIARSFGLEWPDLCNRHEMVTRCEDGRGRICRWQGSSWLTVCRVFPKVGARLLKHGWCEVVERPVRPVSLILPVRGTGRLPSALFVARKLQESMSPGSEVLICEHAVSPLYPPHLENTMRHVWIPAGENESFNKSKAMNAGAREASHDVLLLHDADVWPQPGYVSHGLELLNEGWEAVRALRFLFIIDEVASRRLLNDNGINQLESVEYVQQNNPGLSTMIRRDVYMEIGGHDERFAGWGGEDQEFLDRLSTRQLYAGASLAGVHLWHPPAHQKCGHRNESLLLDIMQEPREQRIARNRDGLAKGGGRA